MKNCFTRYIWSPGQEQNSSELQMVKCQVELRRQLPCPESFISHPAPCPILLPVFRTSEREALTDTPLSLPPSLSLLFLPPPTHLVVLLLPIESRHRRQETSTNFHILLTVLLKNRVFLATSFSTNPSEMVRGGSQALHCLETSILDDQSPRV